MFCGKCGSKMADGARFCPNCGARVRTAAPEATGYRPTAPGYYDGGRGMTPPPAVPQTNSPVVHAPKKKSRAWAAVVVTLVLLIAIGVGALFCFAQTPEKTLNKFCDAVSTLDYRTAVKCINGGSDELYDGALGVAGDLFGADIGAYGDALQGLGGLAAAAGAIPSVEIEIQSVDYLDGHTWLDAKNCTVSATLILMEDGCVQEQEYCEIDMTRDGLKWLIDLDSLLSGF